MKILQKLTLVSALCAFLVGCASMTQQQQAQTTAAVIQVSAQLGTTIAIKEDPNCRPYFVTGKAMIDLALANGDYDPEKLKAALKEVSVKELQDDIVVEAISAAMNLYTTSFQQIVAQKLNTNVWCRPILQGLSAGIGAGINVKATGRRFISVGNKVYRIMPGGAVMELEEDNLKAVPMPQIIKP